MSLASPKRYKLIKRTALPHIMQWLKSMFRCFWPHNHQRLLLVTGKKLRRGSAARYHVCSLGSEKKLHKTIGWPRTPRFATLLGKMTEETPRSAGT